MNEIFEKTAYHESGHIVMTYLNNYFCDETEILSNGDGKTKLNYGSDLLTVAAITHCKENPEIFNELPQNVKLNSPEIAFKSTLILVAGSIAESIYLNNGISGEEMDVEISGPDLERIDNIDFLLSQIDKNHKSDFIPQMMYSTMTLFSDENVWNATAALAQSLLEKEDKKLSKVEIEKTLEDCGFMEYLKNNE